ncbi:MAG: hypothetical protein OXU63_00075 [Acidobacteriota bacterium]|nr:hypothetical protein [Acidobacteriota bacterium]
MDDVQSEVGTTRKVPVEQLRLDRHNPRLVDSTTGATEEAIIAQLHSSAQLGELLHSISTNGYLDIEPLVAVAAPEGDALVVLEGNRRLATLRLLREPDLVRRIASLKQITITIPEFTDAVRPTFEHVTVYQVASREGTRPFIGFKHINGAAKWSAYAKARFAADWYREGEVGIDRIASALGDGHGTIKRMVSAVYVLEQAVREDLFDIEDRYTPKFSFAHLYVALSHSQYLEHLGLAQPWPPDEPRPDPVPAEKLDCLRDVLLWIYGSTEGNVPPAVRTVNPDIKQLGEVLPHAEARELLAAGYALRQAHAATEPMDRRFLVSLLQARSAIRDAAGSLRAYDGQDESLLDITEDVKATSDSVYQNMLGKRREAAGRGG